MVQGEKEEGKETKEEEEVIITPKKISKIELDELTRLHSISDQAPDRVIGTINLRDQARKNILDYHIALSVKYKFNPKKIGIHRLTGDLQMIPKDVLKEKEGMIIQKKDNNNNSINQILDKAMKDAFEQAKKQGVKRGNNDGK